MESTMKLLLGIIAVASVVMLVIDVVVLLTPVHVELKIQDHTPRSQLGCWHAGSDHKTFALCWPEMNRRG